MKNIEQAIDEYVEERRMRLSGLSLQTYLTGRFLLTPSKVVRLMFIVLLLLLFGRDQIRHSRYDCRVSRDLMDTLYLYEVMCLELFV